MQERNPERAPHVLPRLRGLEIWCVKGFSGWGVHGFRVYRAHQLCKLTSLALFLSLSCVFCLLFVVLSLSLLSALGFGETPPCNAGEAALISLHDAIVALRRLKSYQP